MLSTLTIKKSNQLVIMPFKEITTEEEIVKGCIVVRKGTEGLCMVTQVDQNGNLNLTPQHLRTGKYYAIGGEFVGTKALLMKEYLIEY